jgi:hypothetical protein
MGRFITGKPTLSTSLPPLMSNMLDRITRNSALLNRNCSLNWTSSKASIRISGAVLQTAAEPSATIWEISSCMRFSTRVCCTAVSSLRGAQMRGASRWQGTRSRGARSSNLLALGLGLGKPKHDGHLVSIHKCPYCG